MIRTAMLTLLAGALLAPLPAAAERSLVDVLAAQPEAVRDRYTARHPLETLSFFGLEPGMTVVEALPGGGWYSRILIDYLGPDGTLVGADYAPEMFPLFGFFSDEALAAKDSWVNTWTAEAGNWVENGAAVEAFQFGRLPAEMHGSADAVLLIRALHNLARFQPQGGFLSQALADAFAVLKPGGVVGVVQHEARPDSSDELARGDRGYLKRQFVIEQLQAAGFEFVASLGVNQNPADIPGPEDRVWRLPPTMAGTREDPELRAQVEAIGESNRMTLLFRKPAR